MDADNSGNDSARSPEPKRTTDMDSGETGTLGDVGEKLEPEHSEFEDPGFRSVWLMPVGLGIFLAAAALVITVT